MKIVLVRVLVSELLKRSLEKKNILVERDCLNKSTVTNKRANKMEKKINEKEIRREGGIVRTEGVGEK